MPKYLHPGVYVKDIPSDSKPIKSVETSTTAFVGYISRGSVGEPVLIHSWDEYEKLYGGLTDTGMAEDDLMGFSVSAFFQNGGRQAYIVRITRNWKKCDSSRDLNDDSQLLIADYTDVFTKLIPLRDINVICLPGQSWASDGTGNPVIVAAIRHVSQMKNCMLIIDPPVGVELQTSANVNDLNLPDNSYCVFYYPWIKVANPFYSTNIKSAVRKTLLVPPCGYAAGIWARIDSNQGVWKAPAGLQSNLTDTSGFQFDVKDSEQAALNPEGVNCLRKISGAGFVIWGARTLAISADPEWGYISVRRTAIMIEQSIVEGIKWVAFESNEKRLWETLRGSIDNYMNYLFRAGAFQGTKDSDAYFVRCGLGDTMTQTDVDAGQVIVNVGFAPLRPAEFVIISIRQKVIPN